MKIKEFVVDASLPLPPSYSGISKAEQAEVKALRLRLQTAVGHKIILTGQHCANPNYKFATIFKDEAKAQALADLANQFTGNPKFSEVIDISYEL